MATLPWAPFRDKYKSNYTFKDNNAWSSFARGKLTDQQLGTDYGMNKEGIAAYRNDVNVRDASIGTAIGIAGQVGNAAANYIGSAMQNKYATGENAGIMNAITGGYDSNPFLRAVTKRDVSDAVQQVGGIQDNYNDYKSLLQTDVLGNALIDNVKEDPNDFGRFLGNMYGIHLRGDNKKEDNTALLQTRLQGISTGAQIGSMGGIESGLIGAGIGNIFGKWAGIANQFKTDRARREANKEINARNEYIKDSYNTMVDNIDYNNYANQMRSALAFGGNLFATGGNLHSNGADWSNGITQFNAGGTHEENPNGGVPQGVAPDGNPNLVEEGEVRWKDYIFSKRLTLDGKTADALAMNKYANKDFATIATNISKESEERPNDPLATKTRDSLLERLRIAQEEIKIVQQEKELKNQIANMSPEERAAMQEQMLMQMQAQGQLQEQEQVQEQLSPEEQMIQQDNSQQMPEQIGQEQMMAMGMQGFGGNLFSLGGQLNTFSHSFVEGGDMVNPPRGKTNKITNAKVSAMWPHISLKDASVILQENPKMFEFLNKLNDAIEEKGGKDSKKYDITITSGTDYHDSGYHTKGEAVDIRPTYYADKGARDQKTMQDIIYGNTELRGWMLSNGMYALDEYKQKSKGWTGGHFHIGPDSKVRNIMEKAFLQYDKNSGIKGFNPLDSYSYGTLVNIGTMGALSSKDTQKGIEDKLSEYFDIPKTQIIKYMRTSNVIGGNNLEGYKNKVTERKDILSKDFGDSAYNKIQEEINELSGDSSISDEEFSTKYNEKKQQLEEINKGRIAQDALKAEMKEATPDVAEYYQLMEDYKNTDNAQEKHEIENKARTLESTLKFLGIDGVEFTDAVKTEEGKIINDYLYNGMTDEEFLEKTGQTPTNFVGYKENTEKNWTTERNYMADSAYKQGTISDAEYKQMTGEDIPEWTRLITENISNNPTYRPFEPTGIEMQANANAPTLFPSASNQQLNQTSTGTWLDNYDMVDSVIPGTNMPTQITAGENLQNAGSVVDGFDAFVDNIPGSPTYGKVFYRKKPIVNTTPAQQVSGTPQGTPTNASKTTTSTVITPAEKVVINNDTVKPAAQGSVDSGKKVVLSTGAEQSVAQVADNYNKVGSIAPYFAPLIGNALGVALSSLPADYSNADIIRKGYSPVGYTPLGNYMQYKPMDTQRLVNTNVNPAIANARQQAMNVSGGNRGMAMSGIQATNYDYFKALNDMAIHSQEYNDAQKEKVSIFNRDTAKTNAENAMKANVYNQQSLLDVAKNEAAMRDRIDTMRATAIGSSLTGLANELGSLGKTQAMRNMINTNRGNLGYTVGNLFNTMYEK